MQKKNVFLYILRVAMSLASEADALSQGNDS